MMNGRYLRYGRKAYGDRLPMAIATLLEKAAMVAIKVLNPYDQSLVCELPYDEKGVLERNLSEACRAYETWHKLSLDQRIKQVQKGLAQFRRAGEEIARDITLQMGKPIAQSRRCGHRHALVSRHPWYIV